MLLMIMLSAGVAVVDVVAAAVDVVVAVVDVAVYVVAAVVDVLDVDVCVGCWRLLLSCVAVVM